MRASRLVGWPTGMMMKWIYCEAFSKHFFRIINSQSAEQQKITNRFASFF